MRLSEILEKAHARVAMDARAAVGFLGRQSSAPRYAIGKNEETLAVHRFAPLDGIIDDVATPGDLWNGIPLLRTKSARKDGSVVNCSTSIRPVDALDHLVASGFRHVVSLPDLVCVADGALRLPEFVARQRKEISEQASVWQEIHDALEDAVSRRTLIDVLSFRMTADPECMRGYSVRVHEQYFEDFMAYREEVFVDAGGFDGDTAEEFSSRYPDYRKILLFEPSEHNIGIARRRLAAARDVTFFPIGLSDTAARLRFDPDKGSASSVIASGTCEIAVDALDALVEESVSVIKMDLEGWELPALEGAKRHVRDDRPKLAIAVYHDAPDLRRIWQFVESFGHDYKVYLRHYTQGWSETVLFFVPRG